MTIRIDAKDSKIDYKKDIKPRKVSAVARKREKKKKKTGLVLNE
jgi:hypothetical protein